MALQLPANFKSDIESRDTQLSPLVIIGNWDRESSIWDGDYYYISTNPDSGALPILLDITSLKEGIDLEERTYKMSTVNINISDLPYNGKKFTDIIEGRTILNMECRVFWRSPSTTTLSVFDSPYSEMRDTDSMQIYFGYIRRYDQSKDSIKLIVEDKSQDIHKKLPLEETGSGEDIPEKLRNIPKPMVYGWNFTHSPLTFDGKELTIDPRLGDYNVELDEDNNYNGGLVSEGLDDTIPNTPPWSEYDKHYKGVYIGDEEALAVVLETPEEDLGTLEEIYVGQETNEDTGEAAITLQDLENILHTKQLDISDNINGIIKIGLNPLVQKKVLQCKEFIIPDITIAAYNGTTELDTNHFTGFGESFDLTTAGNNQQHSVGHNGISNEFEDSTRFKIKFSIEPKSDYENKNIKYVTMNGFILPFRNGVVTSLGGNGHYNDRVFVSYAYPDGWFLNLHGTDNDGGIGRYHRPDEAGLSPSVIPYNGEAYDTSPITGSLFGYPQFYREDGNWAEFNQRGAVTNDGTYAGVIPDISLTTVMNTSFTPSGTVGGGCGDDQFCWNEIGETAVIYFLDWAQVGYYYPSLSEGGDDTSVAEIGRLVDNGQYQMWIKHNYKGVLTQYLTDSATSSSKLTMSGKINTATSISIVDIPKIHKKKFFAKIRGRMIPYVNGQWASPRDRAKNNQAEIISDIAINELGYEDDIEIPQEFLYPDGDLSQGFGSSFTLNEKIDSKKFFEILSSTAPLITRFNYLSKFKMNTIPHLNPVASDLSGNQTIKENDVIDFSFTLSKIEDVITKLKVRYGYSHVTDNFNHDTGFIYATGLYDGYDINHYNLDDDVEVVIEDDRAKYIGQARASDGYVENYAHWLLSWKCNQHLKIKVKLPLKYMNIELCDIIEFESLLGGIKPYGIDYRLNSPFANRIINGQQAYDKFIVHKTNKTLEYVEIEVTMLHHTSLTSCLSGMYDCLGECLDSADDPNGYDQCDNCYGGCTYEGCEEDYCPCQQQFNPDDPEYNGCNPQDDPPCTLTADCAGECGGDAVLDECGECNGPGATVVCPDSDIMVCPGDGHLCPTEGSFCDSDTSLNEEECSNWRPCYTVDNCNCYSSLADVELAENVMALGLIRMRANFDDANIGWQTDNSFNSHQPCEFIKNQPCISSPIFDNWEISFSHLGGIPNLWEGSELRITFESEDNITLFPENEQYQDFTVSLTHLTPNISFGDSQLFSNEDFDTIKTGNGETFIKVTLYLNASYDGVDRYMIYQFRINIQARDCPLIGDLNADGGFNVLDIVALANCILANNCEDIPNACAADINGDDYYNVLDIVQLANCILLGTCEGTDNE